MTITYHPRFSKSFCKLSLKNQQQALFVIHKFRQNPKDPSLETHPLKGSMLGLFAFKVDPDLRIIFTFQGRDNVILLNVGGHEQVY